MARIRELLDRDLSRTIEEIVQFNQTDGESVFEELTEYVVTRRISEQYRALLQAIADAPHERPEGIGVWISGFFGSGKSSFAKNLGYALANPTVLGHPAAELFKSRFADARIHALVDSINTRIPVELIMFDVSKERSVRRTTERMAEIMYAVLLRELGYAEDFDLADLEITLEEEGRLQEFEAACLRLYDREWRTIRRGANKMSQASAVLHAIDPGTNPAADSWARSVKPVDITVSQFVERAFELCARRRPGKALCFIVDEVGQYVGYSGDKLEDLRAVVEKFGEVGRNRTGRGIPAPAWVVVTSQEKLDEVVAAIDSKKVDLAKLQDRFRHRIDLDPADIREVAARRVLSKTEQGAAELRRLYQAHSGQLNIASRLERTSRSSEVTQDAFVQFYPYLPHYVDLCIDIVSGMRLQPGAPRQLGGSARTIIKQAYEMLVNQRTDLADKPVGHLVTLDRVFELVEGNLSTERRKDIADIEDRFKGSPDDAGWSLRVAKAVCLLEFVRDLPRTHANIAALLVDAIDSGRPDAPVAAALDRLRTAQFVRETEEGYKLQTAQEKNWETEKRAIDPRPRDRNEIKRQVIREIFSEPGLRIIRYQQLRSFRLGITVEDAPAGESGEITLCLRLAEDSGQLAEVLAGAVQDSHAPAHQSDLFWVSALTPETDDLIAAVYASQQMIGKYDLMRAQNRITSEEAALLAGEISERTRQQQRLRERIESAIQAGTGIFRGVSRDGSALGKSAPEALRAFVQIAIPDLYPKLEMGVRPLKGSEADEVLRAANLNGLSQLFYAGDQGLDLVIRDGNRLVPNVDAPIAQELLNFLRLEHSYGNKVTGKLLEERFGGSGYGWEHDILRPVLAVLLRAGAIEVTYQGRRFRSHVDPQCRVPFTSTPAFRSASFAPRESVDLKTLTAAVERYEELTGGEVDVEEAAIAAAVKKFAGAEMALLLPVELTARAHGLPPIPDLEEYRTHLETIAQADSDDCVRILAGEGESLKEDQRQANLIRQALTDAGLQTIARARLVLSQMWPVIKPRQEAGELDSAAEALQALLRSGSFYRDLDEIAARTSELAQAYARLYEDRHHERHVAFDQAREVLSGRSDWMAVLEPDRVALLAPLTSRACLPQPELDGGATCAVCKASAGEMEADLLARDGIEREILARLADLAGGESGEPSVRVRLVDFLGGPVDDEEAVDTFVEEGASRLRDQLHKLTAQGRRVVLE